MSVTVSKKTSVMLIILMIVIPTGKLIYLTDKSYSLIDDDYLPY